MKQPLAVVFGLLIVLVVPASLFAKGETSRITLTGGDLTRPIEITDPGILRHFNVWTGPGVTVGGVAQMEGFIIDWLSGPFANRPAGLRRYELSFYVKQQNGAQDQVVYVVEYERGSSTEQGYVYLPGPADERYRLNTTAILRGREGNWFRATDAWQQVATSALAQAR